MDSRLLNFLVWTLQSLVALTISNWIVYDFSLTFFLVSVVISVLNGLLFIWLIKKVQYRLYQKIEIESINKADTIANTGSNLFVGKLAVGGKLVLTKDRLVFKPHKYNSKQEIIEITFPEIVKMKVSKTLGMVTNKLSILLTSGSYDFIVDEPRRWEIMIKEQIR